MADINDEETNQIVVFLIVNYTPERYISVAVYNSAKRLFQICSFSDNEHYVSLQALLIQLNPKQDLITFTVYCIIPDLKSQRQKILQKLSQYNNKLVESKFGKGEIALPLEFLLKRQLKMYTKQLQNKQEMLVLQKLLSILQLQKQSTNKNQFQLQILNLSHSMKLDKPVINSLQIFPKEMQKKILAGSSTLYEILNRCKTAFGTRCLKRWMKQPLQNKQILIDRLNRIQFYLQAPIIRNIIQNQLKKIPDLDRLYNIFYKVAVGKKNKCDISDLIKIYRVIESLKDLLSNLEKRNIEEKQISSTYQMILKNVNILNKICMMIQNSIEMQGIRGNQVYVKPSTQASLTAIMKEKKQIEKQINEEMRKVSAYLGIEIQKLSSTTYKYVFEASKKNAVEKVKQTAGYKFLTAKQTKITFTTEFMIRSCTNLNNLDDQYNVEQQDILKKMFNIVAGYYPIMEELSILLSELDVITTMATVISTMPIQWCKPKFGSAINGKSMYHPCIKRQCIPNDCLMKDNKTIILTGPNMGGKSTYIRTVGICVYLAHIGCYVPANSFQTPIIDAIITRVGASDMQIKGISTFMSEMIESVCMLQTASSQSLVLIDELGRGTSTSEGYGIAWAICQYLHTKINPYCLFATHFHEMTKMADEIAGVCNMFTSCSINNDKLQLQYKIRQGKMQKSYGIQVARMLEFPNGILEKAEQYLKIYEQRNQYHSDVENQRIKEEFSDQNFQIFQLYRQMQQKMKQNPMLEYCGKIKSQYAAKMKQILQKR